MNEHSTRYMELAQRLADQNYNVHLYDQRGSGYSSGIMRETSLKMLYEDFFSVLINVWKDLPLYIIAHSMGGGVITSLI